jgi:DNA polymerase-4
VNLYADGDGFFASVCQYLNPQVRGKPVGIVPFEGAGAVSIIGASKEAKARGVKGAMRVRDAKLICPEIVLMPSTPDLYRRAQMAILATLELNVLLEAVLSIDECACRMDERQAADPEPVIARIKADIAELFDGVITLSIGVAPSRLLAKIAADAGKPNGFTVFHPSRMPECLYDIPLTDVPGIGTQTLKRFIRAGIVDMQDMLKADVRQIRQIVGSIHGAKMLLALQGYDVHSGSTNKSMFGHGKVLSPPDRKPAAAREIGKILAIKAGRKMRRAGFAAGRIVIQLNQLYIRTVGSAWIPAANDEPALMAAFDKAWTQALQGITDYAFIMSVNIAFGELTRIDSRQLDWIVDDERDRLKAEQVTGAMDALNRRYGTTMIAYGPWRDSRRIGSSIAYANVPDPEVFY